MGRILLAVVIAILAGFFLIAGLAVEPGATGSGATAAFMFVWAYSIFRKKKKGAAARQKSWEPTDTGQLDKVQLEIKYKDAEGQISERRITVLGLEEDGRNTMIFARCHLRNDTRNFRADRIEQIVDTRTGEIIKDDINEWLRGQV